jgi:hypothetical protein
VVVLFVFFLFSLLFVGNVLFVVLLVLSTQEGLVRVCKDDQRFDIDSKLVSAALTFLFF